MPDPEPRDLLAMTGVQEPDRRSIDAAESEAGDIIEAACQKTGWFLSEPPFLEVDRDGCRCDIRLSLVDMPTFACGHAVADALSDKLVALAAELDKRTGRIRFPRLKGK